MELKQDWAFYGCLVENTDASIRLNLGLAEVAPIAGYVYRTWFSFKLLNPSENGLTTQEEFPVACEIEDAVSGILENDGAIMAGTVKNNGTVDLYFYSKQADNHEELIGSVMQNYADYLYATDISEDTQWSNYFDFLYPGEYEMQTIQNRKVLMNLDQYGDNPELEREVDHWIYFQKENNRDSYVNEIKSLGYSVLSMEKIEGEYPFQLNISRVDNTIWDNVDNYVWELVTLAKANNGIYDGWGCPIAK